MAKHTKNDITLGLSGGLGKEVGFRQVAGKTEAFRLPGPRTKNGTSAQEAHKRKFLKASYYAKGVNADPVKKAMYQAKAKPRQYAYQLAMRDYMKPPVIELINFETYTGVVGSKIHVVAVDDFKVAYVRVIIMGINGNVIEQGEAVVQPSGVDWTYTATVANPNPEGKVIVSISDLPGNVVTKEEIL